LGQRTVEVGVVGQQREGDRAQLHLRASQPGALLDRQPHLGAAGEGIEADARFVQQPAGDVGTTVDHAHQPRRQAGGEQAPRP
jgi:hypothetical protein